MKKMLVESLDLLAEQVRRSFVPEDEIGRGHFFHDRTLGVAFFDLTRLGKSQ